MSKQKLKDTANKINKWYIILPAGILVLFLLLPILDSTVGENKSSKAEPQVFSDNPLAKIFSKIVGMFSASNAPTTPSGASIDDILQAAAFQKENYTDEEGNVYSIIRDERGNPIAVTPASYGDAEVMSDGGDWVLVRQTPPGVESKGAYEASSRDYSKISVDKQRKNQELLLARNQKTSKDLQDIKKAAADYESRLAAAKAAGLRAPSGTLASHDSYLGPKGSAQGGTFTGFNNDSGAKMSDLEYNLQDPSSKINQIIEKLKTEMSTTASTLQEQRREANEREEVILEEIKTSAIERSNKEALQEIKKEAAKEKDFSTFNIEKDFSCGDTCPLLPKYNEKVAKENNDEIMRRKIPNYDKVLSAEEKEYLFKEVQKFNKENSELKGLSGYKFIYLAAKEDPNYKKACPNGDCGNMWYTQNNKPAKDRLIYHTILNASGGSVGIQGEADAFVLLSEDEMKKNVEELYSAGNGAVKAYIDTRFLLLDQKSREYVSENWGVNPWQTSLFSKEKVNRAQSGEDFEQIISRDMTNTTVDALDVLIKNGVIAREEITKRADTLVAETKKAYAQDKTADKEASLLKAQQKSSDIKHMNKSGISKETLQVLSNDPTEIIFGDRKDKPSFKIQELDMSTFNTTK